MHYAVTSLEEAEKKANLAQYTSNVDLDMETVTVQKCCCKPRCFIDDASDDGDSSPEKKHRVRYVRWNVRYSF